MAYTPKSFYERLDEPVLVYPVDDTGTPGQFVYTNPRAQELLQYEKQQLAGLSIIDLCEIKRFPDLLALHKNGKPEKPVFELTFLTAHQSTVKFDVSVDVVQQDGKLFIEIVFLTLSTLEDQSQANDRFYTMASFLHEGLAILENRKIVFTNKAMDEITGFNAGEISTLAESIEFLAAPEEKKRVRELLNEMQKNPEEKHVLDFWMVAKNGERKYIHNSYSQHKTTKGVLQYIVTQDITQRKRAEIEVKQKEKEFKALAENSSGVIALFNRELGCVYINPAGAEIIGKPCNELINANLADFGLPDKLYRNLKNNIINVFAENEQAAFEAKFPVKDTTKNLHCVIIPETFVEGVMDTAVAICSDITELRRTKHELDDITRKYDLIVNNLTDVIWILDDTFIINYITPGIEKLTGYTVEEYLQREYEDVFDADGLESINQVIQQISHGVKTGNHEQIKQAFTFEARQKRKDGSYVWVEIIARPLFDDNDKFLGMNGVTRDISKRKKAEFDLVEAKEKAVEADRLKSAFLANMSHEIRTPMNAIIGFTDLLNQDDVDPASRSEYVELINSNSTHLLKLIDDIIDISKIEAGELKISKAEAELEPIFSQTYHVQKEALKKAGKSHIELSYNLPGKNIEMITDPMRLQQILTNLVSNSIKFTSEGKIEFGVTAHDKDSIKFYVQDTGVGMSKEKMDYIFDRFRQVEEHTSRQYQGSGLGLAISKQLVELLGGEIWVDSQENKGTTFYFTLPHKWAGEHGLEDVIEQKEEDITNLMIVEDEDANYQLLKEMLKKRNFRIFRAHDGIEAVEIANEENLELVLMDIQLPKMDGYEATKKIKQEHPNLPIIAQTAYANYNDVVKSLDAGCSDFIAKPIKMKKLLSMIDKYLSNES